MAQNDWFVKIGEKAHEEGAVDGPREVGGLRSGIL